MICGFLRDWLTDLEHEPSPFFLFFETSTAGLISRTLLGPPSLFSYLYPIMNSRGGKYRIQNVPFQTSQSFPRLDEGFQTICCKIFTNVPGD